MSSDSDFLRSIIDHLREHTERAQDTFAPLTETQLNWQPTPSTWSMGLILDHLIITNRSYFPVLESIGKGSYKMNLWTRISPFSGAMGRSMVKQLGPDSAKKYTSPPAFRPTRSKVAPEVLQKYLATQDELIALIGNLEGKDSGKLKIPSPASGFITYSLHNALRVIDVHTARHLQQADRLMALQQFPK